MELRQYFNTIRKWLWLILLATLVATVSSFIATRQQPPIYSSKTTLIVGSTIENPNPTGNDIWLGQQLAQTYAELAKRDAIKQGAMQALGLTWLPQYSVTLVPNTQLLEINVVDTDPVRAQAVAQEVARQLIEQSPSAPEREQIDRQAFVTKQLQELETNIDATKVRIEELQTQLAGMFSARQIADTQTQIAALGAKASQLPGQLCHAAQLRLGRRQQHPSGGARDPAHGTHRPQQGHDHPAGRGHRPAAGVGRGLSAGLPGRHDQDPGGRPVCHPSGHARRHRPHRG